jgi:hypothetical protein
MRTWSNSEESGNYACTFQINSGVATCNILATKSEEGPLPYC